MGSVRSAVWNWLPVFLEIAERGSVAKAAASLHVTPAAVSRTLRLLEDELGEPVFNRVGRSLVLNRRGEALRDAMRNAVVTVDRGLDDTLADPFAGSVRVASLGVLTEHFVVPVLIELKEQYPALTPEHQNLGTADATQRLARSELDVAFYYEEIDADGIVAERLGRTGTAVYCGQSHPLFRRRRIRESDVLGHAFSVPQVGDSGRVMDGWPIDLPRTIGMRITMLRSNLQVCLSGGLLTVLPDVTAHPHVEAGALRRLPFRALPDIEVFAATPAAGLPRGVARTVIDAVGERLEA